MSTNVRFNVEVEAVTGIFLLMDTFPAMGSYSILSYSSPPSTLPIPTLKTSTFLHPQQQFQLRNLGFCCPKPIGESRSFQFKIPYKFSSSFFPMESSELSDDDDGDDDDDEAADEFGIVSEEVPDGVEETRDEIASLSEDDSSDSATTFEELRWQSVERLRKDVREFGEEIIDVDELASIYGFRIDKFQRLAIEAFLKGSSVVVSAPTSSGKTLIAEAAAVATAARGRRLFYTTPLKALSNQKFREFRETFGDSSVGLLTGDSSVNRDAEVLVMTTEILRNMLYQSVRMDSSESGLFHVDVIVLDEVHYLSDISRGTVWEEIVIYCPKEVQLICLSATVANPDELAGWIGQIHGKTELVTSSKRPVPLTWHFSMKIDLYALLDEKGKGINRKLSLNYLQHDLIGQTLYKDQGSSRKNFKKRRESDLRCDSDAYLTGRARLSKSDINTIRRSQVPQIVDTLWQLKARDMLPALWFIFSRKGCDAAVNYLEDCKLLDECEMGEVAVALKRFRIQHPDAVRESSVKGLLQGVAAHHAGCLPLWKSFIENLFQRGLIKVVFATETLAAGMNMPARTAVISSLSKRIESGRAQLSSNELLQMAGRAGRRGIDEKGHAVLVQTPYEGAEECCKLLYAGLEPLVSQFTPSYGMVLNLLAGVKVTRRVNESDEVKVMRTGRTLEEARKLIEQSFGNYVGSSVMLAAKEELDRVQNEIEILNLEISDEAIDKKSRQLLSEMEYNEIAGLQEELREAKHVRAAMRRCMDLERVSSLKHLLKELKGRNFMCLQYIDNNGVHHSIIVVYVGHIDSFNVSEVKDMVSSDDSAAGTDTENNEESSYHVALGSDNSWYLFSEKWIKTVYRTGFPNEALSEGDPLPREILSRLLRTDEMQWEKLANSELGGLWHMEGSIETWSWSLNVPVLSSLSEDDEILQFSQAYHDAVESYKDQRNKVSRLKKKIARTEGFKEYRKILDMANFKLEKIRRLRARSSRLISRIEQIEPSGWKEFLQVSNVIHESRALDVNTNVIFPLGETAGAIRGENELWLAMVLRNKALLDLRPAQLAAVCGSLVSEGIKVRPWKNNSYMYEPSATVIDIISVLHDLRSSLLELQDKHGVEIPCCLDSQFSGMVEAWASGLTWKEIMMDCAMDEGDLARLLRRTIDLLAQVPKLPDIDPVLQRNATLASNVMDRPPISELAG